MNINARWNVNQKKALLTVHCKLNNIYQDNAGENCS